MKQIIGNNLNYRFSVGARPQELDAVGAQRLSKKQTWRTFDEAFLYAPGIISQLLPGAMSDTTTQLIVRIHK